MVKHVRHQKESSSSNDYDSEEMTSIDIVPHQPPLPPSNNGPPPTAQSAQFAASRPSIVDRSSLEDQAVPNPLYDSHYRDSLHHHNHQQQQLQQQQLQLQQQRNSSSYGRDGAHPTYHKQAKVQPFLQMIKSKFFISCLILAAVFVTLLCIGLVVAYEKENDVTHSIDAWKDQLSAEQSEWFDSGLDELKVALQTKQNTRRAKNVVIFVGDGMGPNTATATRVHTHGEEGTLAWERFPHMAMLKTYCANRLVPDSAVAATALFGGVKANYDTAGVDSSVPLRDCEASLRKANQVDSIMRWAQEEGMATGFVTTTRVVHATPAALYAHTADRRWECDSQIPPTAQNIGCKDIGRQLIEDEPGRDLNVIMGGGRQCLVAGVEATPDDPIDAWSCVRSDGRDLVDEWRRDKAERFGGKRHAAVVQTRGELETAMRRSDGVDYLLGVFANGNMQYEHERNNGTAGQPSIVEMTEAAIAVLSRNAHGFILMVEGGMIDMAHHRGWARRAVAETAALEAAVQRAKDLLRHEADETLLIVTADHTHTLSINGYAPRGADIFGIAQRSRDTDQLPYTTLTYATGAASAFQVEVGADGKARRRDPSRDDTTAYDYQQQVAVATNENTHGGGDVTVHAIGPMAHLFHRVHEQSYVAHVISYAARIGRFRDNQLVQSFLDMLGIV